ncbi:hypothetical protein DXG03_008026 [Asterophora parasitica]|uniref:glucan endo-1,3-beta-D-glucosidase n=1 Tax=Asterophora parasitica TaxID=117018 RepID=A0A9P7G836_9AGAR|nr:hypothetical protein DXG03_008026 [Asterophora parasitica]
MYKLFFTIAACVLPTFAANNFYGIATANSIGGTGSYTCRSQAQWNTLAKDAKNSGFKSIRVTGFDCDALARASSAAAANGLKVLAGIYVSGSIAGAINQINNEVQLFRSAYGVYGAGRYEGLTIGNEVNDSAGNIMNKVYDVRGTYNTRCHRCIADPQLMRTGYLKSVGVTTPVSTVHTWVAIRDNPALCGADFVGANAHAFYDGNRNSGQAGDFVLKTVIPALKAKCPGKKIYITETGWPSRGNRFGSSAVASINDERTALQRLNCAARDDRSVSLYAFEYDDQNWKGNDNERSFGIFPKFDLNDVFSSC